MPVNIEAEVNKKTINVPVELQSLTQDIEVNFVPSIIYAFSPIAKIEYLQNGNYLITITDKNGTTTGEVPVVTQETIDLFIGYYLQRNPLIQNYIAEHNISETAHEDIRNLIASASNSVPLMDGIGAAGSSKEYARSDHQHPSDTAKADKASTLQGYGITDAMTTSEVLSAIQESKQSFLLYKGKKRYFSDLPKTNNAIGHVWNVTENNNEYLWNGSAWEQIGPNVDLSSYLTTVIIAGMPLSVSKYVITEEELKAALGLADAAYKDVDSSIVTGSTSQYLPTSQAVAQYVATAATKVTQSETNGNIKINNVETNIYTLPSSVVDQTDILILNGGNASSTYT